MYNKTMKCHSISVVGQGVMDVGTGTPVSFTRHFMECFVIVGHQERHTLIPANSCFSYWYSLTNNIVFIYSRTVWAEGATTERYEVETWRKNAAESNEGRVAICIEKWNIKKRAGKNNQLCFAWADIISPCSCLKWASLYGHIQRRRRTSW